MQELLPSGVPVCTMPLGGGRPQDLLAGLVAQMRLVSLIAAEMGKDPAKPHVPSFGRELYYVDLPSFIPGPEDAGRRGEQSKFEVLGARWPSIGANGAMSRALASFESALALQPFRAIVFDYDGTYRVGEICRDDRFKELKLKSLYLGLSDGARTNELRRASNGEISNEQIWQAYELGEAKAEDMLQALAKALKKSPTTHLPENDDIWQA